MRRGLLIFVLLFPGMLWADSVEEIQAYRLKNGMWVGLGITTGALSMSAPTARSRIKLTALPIVALGFEEWVADAIGVHLRGTVGLPATISNVLGKDVAFKLYTGEAGLVFRHFSGLRSSASAWLISSSLRMHIEDAQEQRPSVLVSRAILSPSLKIGFEHFIIPGKWWLRGYLGGAYPFFVRESPTDSGRPDVMVSGLTELNSCYHLTSQWGVFTQMDVLYQSFEHGGEATRGGGLSDVSTQDYYFTTLIGIRFVHD